VGRVDDLTGPPSGTDSHGLSRCITDLKDQSAIAHLLTPRSDIFQTGVVFFEVFGHDPHDERALGLEGETLCIERPLRRDRHTVLRDLSAVDAHLEPVVGPQTSDEKVSASAAVAQSPRNAKMAKVGFIFGQLRLLQWLYAHHGFVAQIGLRSCFPFPRTDLAYGDGTGYAKSCEAVQDRGADLDLSNLAIKVARRQALTKQFHTMHFRLDAASTVISR
jgi:hypothetical protein